jgi:hypothetical protein
MSLKRALRSGVAAACIVSLAAPAGVQAQSAPPQVRAAGPDVRVATAATFWRVEIGGPVTTRRDGRTITLTFAAGANPDVARLRTSPPRWIEKVERRTVGARLELVLTLAEDADARIGRADGATYVNVFEADKAESEAEAPAAPEPATPAVEVAEAEPERPDPLPSKIAGGQVQYSFAFANPAGAAVFRRGDAVWVVFDAPAKLDVSKTPRGVASVRGAQAITGADHAAVRIDVVPDAPVFVVSQGATWTVAVGPGGQPQPSIVRVARDAAAGTATLRAPVAGATRVINLPDPVVGDTLKVVTALGPPKGLPIRREFVELALLPSIQGLAIEPRVDDLNVQRRTGHNDPRRGPFAITHLGRQGARACKSGSAGTGLHAGADPLRLGSDRRGRLPASLQCTARGGGGRGAVGRPQRTDRGADGAGPLPGRQ